MQAVLADWQITMLAQVFQKDSLHIPTSNIEMPSALRINWEQVASQTPQGAYFPNEEFLTNISEYKQNKFIHIGNTSYTTYKLYHTNISCAGAYPNYLFLYKEVLPYLREHLLFKADIQGLATQLLEQIRSEDISGKPIVFVGVHCRRGDYAAQLQVGKLDTVFLFFCTLFSFHM